MEFLSMDYININNKYIIRPSKLVGEVNLSGAKNSALRLLAASILTSDEIIIDNFPTNILDAQIHIDMLKKIGKLCKVQNSQVIINENREIYNKLEWDDFAIRNTLLILGALVARTGSGSVPLPGGCKLGERKYDLHEMILKKMGAEVWSDKKKLYAHTKSRLKGADIHLPIRSTGATENAILCGTLAEGTTRIWNPHFRPEIMDLIFLLRKMGAKIDVYGQEHICIHGVEGLSSARHNVISDNMEAITWLIGSVITNGDVEIIGFPFDHLEVPMIHLRESGARFFRGDDRLIVRGGCCYPIDISTGPYPGINSDMQPLLALFGLCARGESCIIDLRFPGRYQYAEEMKKMGAKFKVDGNILRIYGGYPLKGSRVLATDLRAGVALAFAGLVAEGETIIDDAWQIERGYNDFTTKLKGLGGQCYHD